MKQTKTFRESLIKFLKDPVSAFEYINTVLEDRDVDFLCSALRDVAEAQGGLSKISRQTKRNRGNLRKFFSKHGNPSFASIQNILKDFGLRFSVVEDKEMHYRKTA